MKSIFLAFALGLSVVGCGNNDCDDAVDKLKQCGFDTSSGGVDTGDCSGKSECAAKCINAASCSEITGQTTTGSYFTCLSKC